MIETKTTYYGDMPEPCPSDSLPDWQKEKPKKKRLFAGAGPGNYKKKRINPGPDKYELYIIQEVIYLARIANSFAVAMEE